jgi:hypothetical protein
VSSEYKLTGFIDAQGRIVSTAFRKAFEFGGVFLFGETDASMPGALLAFNTALANGWMDFPDGVVQKHPDFRVVADANTFGTGADRLYVGRNQLDAASLDRYAVLDWPYDEALEAALSGCRRLQISGLNGCGRFAMQWVNSRSAMLCRPARPSTAPACWLLALLGRRQRMP